MKYRPTHVSRHDGPDAQFLGRYHKRALNRSTFRNENGDIFTDDTLNWKALPH